MPGLIDHIKTNRNAYLVSIIGFIIVSVFLNRAFSVIDEFVKRFVFSDETTAAITRIDSSTAAFPGQSLEVYQLFAYEISASDLLKNVKVTVVFGRKTEIILYNVVYSVDVEGFQPSQPQNHYLEVTLKHDLDLRRKARLYLLTRREVDSPDQIKPEFPDVSVDGVDRKKNLVHRAGLN